MFLAVDIVVFVEECCRGRPPIIFAPGRLELPILNLIASNSGQLTFANILLHMATHLSWLSQDDGISAELKQTTRHIDFAADSATKNNSRQSPIDSHLTFHIAESMVFHSGREFQKHDFTEHLAKINGEAPRK